jgi:hypothetical protein
MAKTKSAEDKENTEFKLENLNDKDDSADSSSESELDEQEKEAGSAEQNPVSTFNRQKKWERGLGSEQIKKKLKEKV